LHRSEEGENTHTTGLSIFHREFFLKRPEQRYEEKRNIYAEREEESKKDEEIDPIKLLKVRYWKRSNMRNSW
jgi:hypothetical protein